MRRRNACSEHALTIYFEAALLLVWHRSAPFPSALVLHRLRRPLFHLKPRSHVSTAGRGSLPWQYPTMDGWYRPTNCGADATMVGTARQAVRWVWVVGGQGKCCHFRNLQARINEHATRGGRWGSFWGSLTFLRDWYCSRWARNQ